MAFIAKWYTFVKLHLSIATPNLLKSLHETHSKRKRNDMLSVPLRKLKSDYNQRETGKLGNQRNPQSCIPKRLKIIFMHEQLYLSKRLF